MEAIESGMIVGLGTGSTTSFALIRIAGRIQSGDLKNIIGISTSIRTENLARELNIPLATLDEKPQIDVTIDGADEVDPELNLIKGGGGALLREKVVAQASRTNIIIVDESKLSDSLGSHWALPVEVIPFAAKTEAGFLESLGATVAVRRDEKRQLFKTDQHNYILDADFGAISIRPPWRPG